MAPISLAILMVRRTTLSVSLRPNLTTMLSSWVKRARKTQTILALLFSILEKDHGVRFDAFTRKQDLSGLAKAFPSKVNAFSERLPLKAICFPGRRSRHSRALDRPAFASRRRSHSLERLNILQIQSSQLTGRMGSSRGLESTPFGTKSLNYIPNKSLKETIQASTTRQS